MRSLNQDIATNLAAFQVFASAGLLPTMPACEPPQSTPAPVTEQDIITTIGIKADSAIAAAAGANERLRGYRAQQARIADLLQCEPQQIEEEVTRVAAMVGRCVDCGRCATYQICDECLEARR